MYFEPMTRDANRELILGNPHSHRQISRTRFMATSGGQRSPFGFEEAFKGEDAFKEGRGGIQEELMRTNKQNILCALLYRFGSQNGVD